MVALHDISNSDPAFLLFDDRAAGAISPFSAWGMGPGFIQTLVGAAWPAANRALFVPFRVPIGTTVQQMVVGAGSTAGGNFDLGIYDADGNRLVSSGSLARTASAENIADLTDTLLEPGLYYLAMAADSTNSYAAGQPNTQVMKLMGMRQMATAFPLPATATFATVTSNFLPWFCAYLKHEATVNDAVLRWPPLNLISAFHTDSYGLHTNAARIITSGISSTAPGANVIVYVPFRLAEDATALSIGYIVGGTSDGNVLVGIYNSALNLVVSSASTAQGTINVFQEVDLTDTYLTAGHYFMALQFSSATGTYYHLAAADENVLPNLPVYTETAGSFALPSTATPALSTAATVGIPAIATYFNTLV